MEDQVQRSPAELQVALLAVCDRHGWSASFIQSKPQSREQLVHLCVKELAACRAAGRGELAVALADSAVAAGLEHPRLTTQRERARQQGGALARRDPSGSSALAGPAGKPKKTAGFWRWLPRLSGKPRGKTSRPATPGTAAQTEELGAVCRAAGWSPQVINGDLAQRDLPKALLRELRACSAAGEHQLVLQLCRTAAKLGIQHPRIKRARRQAQALLDSALHSQLETAIQLREGGQPAASLALLDAALNAGHRSPWIDDNRARALVDLDRRAEAIPLWEQLQGHGDSAVADAARQMLDLQRQQLLVPLHDSVHQLAEQHAWPLQRLGDPTVLDLQAYSTSLLKEAIDARDNGHPDLSLALLDAVLAAGLANPWLLDNRARALVHLHRLPEAVAIWQQLSQQEDVTLRTTAQEMVERFAAQARRQALLSEAEALIGNGRFGQAVELLQEEPNQSDGSDPLIPMAIQLREGGQPGASLALLDGALNAGHHSPWINDNRARALVDLGRRPEAIALWEQLLGHEDPGVVDAAQQMLQLHRLELLVPLQDSLHQLADQHAWPLRHLGDPTTLDLQAFTTSLLQEAIDARDNGHPDLSLALLDAALAAGLANPWLLDNRARALVHLRRLPEAVAIWQQLSQQEDGALRTSAQEMVERFGAEARRQALLSEAAELEQADELEQAISLLTNALLGDPQCLDIQSRLQHLLAQRDGALPNTDDDSSQELEPHRRGLLAFTEVLNTLEERLLGDQPPS